MSESIIETARKIQRKYHGVTIAGEPLIYSSGGAIHFREIAGRIGRGVKELARKGVRTAGVAAREARETVEPYAKEFAEIEMEAYRRRRLGQPTERLPRGVPGYVYAPTAPIYVPPMRISGLPMKTLPIGAVIANLPKPMSCTSCGNEYATGERALKFQNTYICPYCGGNLALRR